VMADETRRMFCSITVVDITGQEHGQKQAWFGKTAMRIAR
jgi:hypothetical protein